VNGRYHEFEDADLAIRYAKWLDMISVTGLINNENEKEVRGIYHFLDQCKNKIGFDYIQVSPDF
jgi:diphthamide synthase (EF-2-diphthine--ammonia ligase)